MHGRDAPREAAAEFEFLAPRERRSSDRSEDTNCRNKLVFPEAFKREWLYLTLKVNKSNCTGKC